MGPEDVSEDPKVKPGKNHEIVSKKPGMVTEETDKITDYSNKAKENSSLLEC